MQLVPHHGRGARGLIGLALGALVVTFGLVMVIGVLHPAHGQAAGESLTNAEVNAIVAAALAQANSEDSLVRRSSGGVGQSGRLTRRMAHALLK